jgi:hypothetical protein
MKKVFPDSEPKKDSVIRNFRTTESDGKKFNTRYCNRMQEFGAGDIEQRPTIKKSLIVQTVASRHAWCETEEVWNDSV